MIGNQRLISTPPQPSFRVRSLSLNLFLEAMCEPEAVELWIHTVAVPIHPNPSGHNPHNSQDEGLQTRTGGDLQDGCLLAVHTDNFISTFVSHSKIASGCQNGSGIHLADVMPKTFEQLNALPLVFLKLNYGSLLQIREYSKYLEQKLLNTVETDLWLKIKDFDIHFSYSMLQVETVSTPQTGAASVCREPWQSLLNFTGNTVTKESLSKHKAYSLQGPQIKLLMKTFCINYRS